MDALHRTLIPPPVLASHLGDPAWVVVDCRFTVGDPERGTRHFALGRIPGARYAHLDKDLAAPPSSSSGRHPLPQAGTFASVLGDLGIGPSCQVVVYDDSFGSVAARLWWLLRWIGHEAVALLDGGWPAWKRLQLPIDGGVPRHHAGGSPYPVRPNPSLLVNAELVEHIRRDAAWHILDARPEERFTGEREPVDPIAGHIPGSVSRTFEDNLDFDGRFLSPGQLRQDFLARLNGVSPERTVHTCGSGVTACHNILAMEHAGLPGSKLYAGSWSEWIANSLRPVAVGFP